MGRSGGLALLWKEEVEVIIHNYSLNHISGWVSDLEKGMRVLFIGFYGALVVSKRVYSWDLLSRINPGNSP